MRAFILLADIAKTALVGALIVAVFLLTGWHTGVWPAWRQPVPAGAIAVITAVPLVVLTWTGQWVALQHATRPSYAGFSLATVGLLAVGIVMLGTQSPGLAIQLEVFLIAISILLIFPAAEERHLATHSLKEAEKWISFTAVAAGLSRCHFPRRHFCRLIVGALPFCLPATAANRPHILIINAWDDTMPAAVLTTTAFRNQLAASPLKNAEIYYDNLDLSRFSAGDYQERMAHWLSDKYADKRPDILIALGHEALEYLLRYRDTFAPGAPIIVCYWAGATPANIASLSNVTGVFSEFNWSKTLALAARLQPNARDVAIVSGASVPFWEDEARRQLAPRLGPYKVRHLAGLPYDKLLNEVAHLPRNTIVLILPIFKDGDGVSRIPATAAADVARASSAPTYAPIETFMGTGLVGGYMDLFEASGTAAAKLTLEVLERKDAVLPPPIATPHNFVVDVRQLQRWGLSQNRLPIGTTLLFKEPTLWEQYKPIVIATVCLFALLVALLLALSFQVLKRRRAEATLEASEERMKFAAAATDTGLWRYDIASKHIWATEHCRSMFGLKADSPLTPEAFLDAVHPDDRAAVIEAMLTAVAPGEAARRNEFRVMHSNDQIRWYLATTSTAFDGNGKPTGVSGIFRDVTPRKNAEREAKQLEDALQATRETLTRVSRQTTIGVMAASIAHEVNQPLSALVTNGGIGLLLLAKPDSDHNELRDVLKRIVDDGHRASNIIAGIRAMFKRDRREQSPVNIRDLVHEVIALVRGELYSHSVSLRVELGQELPRVLADRVQLQQVLLNLIMNAVEAMSSVDNGDRSLRVKAEVHGPLDVLITVEDSGPGIDPNDMYRIFDAFFTTKSHGTGLGLSICRSIVESHGGRLWASNRNPHGSVFHIELPGEALAGE